MFPSFPQEIIDLIIDEVAHLPVIEAPNSIKACCLVSKLFYPRSRKHIFSCIDFCANENGQERADRLLHILENTRDDTVTKIRTFKFNIMVNKSLGYGIQSYLVPFNSTKQNIDSRVDALLELMARLPLVNLKLKTTAYYTDWHTVRTRIAFHTLVTKSSLQCLHLEKIDNVPPSIIRIIVFSSNLVELRLRSVDIGDELEESNAVLSHTLPSLAQSSIKRLKMSRMEYSSFFSAISCLPQAPLLSPILHRLHSLALSVSVPYFAMDFTAIWNFILLHEASLDMLQLTMSQGFAVPIINSTSLTHLKMLRHLKFDINLLNCSFFDGIHDHGDPGEIKTALVTLLAIATTIETITLNFKVRVGSQDQAAVPLPASGLLSLDRTLSNPDFAALKKIEVIVKLGYRIQTGKKVMMQPETRILDVRSMFPMVAGKGRVELSLTCFSIGSSRGSA